MWIEALALFVVSLKEQGAVSAEIQRPGPSKLPRQRPWMLENSFLFTWQGELAGHLLGGPFEKIAVFLHYRSE